MTLEMERKMESIAVIRQESDSGFKTVQRRRANRHAKEEPIIVVKSEKRTYAELLRLMKSEVDLDSTGAEITFLWKTRQDG